MLVNFSVQNFGSIKDKQTLSFEADKSMYLEDYYVINTNGLRLLKLGLIFGANASGKTMILKALDFLRTLVLYPKIQKTETLEFEPFLFDENTPLQNTVFEIEFIQNNKRYLYKVELNKEAIIREELYSFYRSKANIFKRSTDLQSKFTKIEFGHKMKISKSVEETLENNTLWNNTVLGGFLKTNMDAEEFVAILDWFGDYLSTMVTPQTNLSKDFKKTLSNDKYKEAIVQILKQADFNISNYFLKDKNGNDEYMQKKNNLTKKEYEDSKRNGIIVDINDFIKLYGNTSITNINFEHTVKGNTYLLDFDLESQGTQRYYTFACLLITLVNNSVLVSVDELESSLHPDLFIHFLLSFLTNSKQSQLLATTHNREILNDKEIFRNDAIWITDKNNENSATELYSLADFDTKVIRDTTNILNAYKLGKLGGVPNLGDYYIDIENDEKK